jgi:hypothetical protein
MVINLRALSSINISKNGARYWTNQTVNIKKIQKNQLDIKNIIIFINKIKNNDKYFIVLMFF